MKKQLIIVMALVTLIPSMGLAGPEKSETSDGSMEMGVKNGSILVPSGKSVHELSTLSAGDQESVSSLFPQNKLASNEACLACMFQLEGDLKSALFPVSILATCVSQNTPVDFQFEGGRCLCSMSGGDPVAILQRQKLKDKLMQRALDKRWGPANSEAFKNSISSEECEMLFYNDDGTENEELEVGARIEGFLHRVRLRDRPELGLRSSNPWMRPASGNNG